MTREDLVMGAPGITWTITHVKDEARAIEYAVKIAHGEGYRIEFFQTDESETPHRTLEQLPLGFITKENIGL